MWTRATDRLRAFGRPVAWVASDAEQLDLAERSADTAVSTLTLCSVSNPSRVLAGLHRVLRDDGQLIVVEHGLSTDARVARWQRRLNGLQNVVACGCHLTRPIVNLVRESGFEFAGETFFVRGIPRTHGCVTAGVARKVGSETG